MKIERILTGIFLVFFFVQARANNANSSESVFVNIDSTTRENGLLIPKKYSSDPNPSPYKIKKVVIDAGHGGKDPGCVGAKTTEKKIALDLALKVGAKIKAAHPEVEVIYTRKTDVFLELHERAAVANKSHADFFISIHCNATTNKKVYGTETFVLGLHRAKDNLNVAKRENEAIFFEDDYQENYSGYDPNSPEGHILLSFFQNAFLNQSISFAEKVERNFVNGKRHSRGVKQDGFLVLRHATMPAVLVEAGFLSNLDEEAFLMSDKGQEIIASGIAKAFTDYKEQSEIFQQPLLASNQLSSEAPISDGVIEFCVQFLSSPGKTHPDAAKFQTWGKLKVRKEGSTYKYQIAALPNYDSANKMKQILLSKGYKDAFITAYNGGERISVQQAVQLMEAITAQ